MLENFFLTYSNYSLINNSKKFHGEFNIHLSKEEEELTLWSAYLGRLKIQIKYLPTFAKLKSLKEAEQFARSLFTSKNKLRQDDGLDHVHYGIIRALFRQTTGYCEQKCSFRAYRQKLFSAARFSGSGRIRCIECNQLFFMNIINQIAENKKYAEIDGFQDIMALCETLQYLRGYFINNKGELEVFTRFELIDLDNILLRDEYDNPADELLLFAAYSLTEFIIKNDRRKIRKCINCKMFYISKTSRDSKFCSDKCRLGFHNRKRIESGEHARYKREKGYYKY